MENVSLLGAALAGLLAFFSPCVLPMVPFYLSYMGGMSMAELREGGTIAPGAQRRMVLTASFFALGIFTTFALLGLGATALGLGFREWIDELTYAAALFIFLFGLHFLGILKIPFLMREARMQSRADPRTVLGAYAMGLAFSFGWTACVGPVLASILMLAAMRETMTQGMALVLVFGLAMTAPFVIAAAFAKPFISWMNRHRSLMGHTEKVMGAMLVLFAVLLATNRINLIADWLIRTFDWSWVLR